MTFARLLDPAALALVGLAAAIAWLARAPVPSARARRARAAAIAIIALGLVASTPYAANAALRALEAPAFDLAAPLPSGDERVVLLVLGAGLRTDEAWVPPSERLDGVSQARVLAAARVAADPRVDALVMTGAPRDVRDGMIELARALGVPEAKLHADEAIDWASIGRDARRANDATPARFGVVTSALEVKRATRSIARAGVVAFPLATDVASNPLGGTWEMDDFWPSSWALVESGRALHEALARLAP